jgi:hypothetical protein
MLLQGKIWHVGSCIPLYNFDYTYNYVMSSPKSFVDRYVYLSARWLKTVFKQEVQICGQEQEGSWIPIHCTVVFYVGKFLGPTASESVNQLFVGSWFLGFLCSFVHSRDDQYNPKMRNVVPREKWRKGSQVFIVPLVIFMIAALLGFSHLFYHCSLCISICVPRHPSSSMWEMWSLC